MSEKELSGSENRPYTNTAAKGEIGIEVGRMGKAKGKGCGCRVARQAGQGEL